MDGKDEVLARKLDGKLREDQWWISTLRREELDGTVRFKQVTGREADQDLLLPLMLEMMGKV